MAEVAKNKKYLKLDEVRVSYKASDDSIHLISPDKDLPQGLHLTLQKGTHVEEQLRSLLAEKGLLPDSHSEDRLSSYLPWNENYYTDPIISPYFFPLGEVATGGLKVLNPYQNGTLRITGVDFTGSQQDHLKALRPFSQTNHLCVLGGTGSGKTVVTEALLSGVALRPQHWEAIVLTSNSLDYACFKHFPNITVGKPSKEAALSLLEATATNLRKLKSVTAQEAQKKTLIIIDGYSTFVTPEYPDQETKGLEKAIKDLVETFCSQGRAFGIHMVIVDQEFSSQRMSPALKENIDTFLMMGYMPASAFSVLPGEGPTKLSRRVVGRGFRKTHKETHEFQAFALNSDLLERDITWRLSHPK